MRSFCCARDALMRSFWISACRTWTALISPGASGTGRTGTDARTPILLLSALPLSGNARCSPDISREAENCRFLLKPVRMAQLAETLDDMLTGVPDVSRSAHDSGDAGSCGEDIPVFIRQDALDAAGGSVSLLQRMIDAFLEEIPSLSDMLKQCPLSAPELRRTAHSLKNSAGLLGLPRLRAICAALESAVPPENPPLQENSPADRPRSIMDETLRADAVRELSQALAALRREQEKNHAPSAGDR